jgi:O-antigen ligase
MWFAHFMSFRGNGFAAWVGLIAVAQNVVGSLFNSHLFDFVPGWIYVLSVGIAGGMVLRLNEKMKQSQLQRTGHNCDSR